MLIDIHTHNENKNSYLAFLVGKHSLGIHPWELTAPFVESEVREKFLQLKTTFHPKILAIGECGFDRRREGIAEIGDQEKVLEWHMDWASEVGRPLVLHCVKASSDLLKMLKQKNYKGKILLHDFAGNLEEANQFLHHDCYFSFGKSLFRKDGKAAEVFSMLPREHLFLESDDHRDHTLLEIYQKAAQILKIDFNECEKIFEENLKRFFLDLNDVSSSDVINYLS